MARRAKRATAKRTKRAAPASRRRAAARRSSGGFVGRDASPVLDKYPPKASAPAPPPPLTPPRPPAAAAKPATPVAASPTPAALSANDAAPPPGLITLERPFDVDEFSQLLGETTIRVTVPKEDLGEVLRRITDFMGFGIYVYSFHVRPAADESLRRFQVELRRVDYSGAKGDWVAFEETGRSDSPFGPGARP